MSTYTAETFFGRGVRTGECLLWPGKAKVDERYVTANFRGKPVVVQRIAYMLSTGKTLQPSPIEVIRQTCRNFTCIEPKHLVCEPLRRDVSVIAASIRTRYGDLMPEPGECLTAAHRAMIRHEWSDGVTPRRAIAEAFGLTASQVGHVVHRGEGGRGLMYESKPGQATGT